MVRNKFSTANIDNDSVRVPFVFSWIKLPVRVSKDSDEGKNKENDKNTSKITEISINTFKAVSFIFSRFLKILKREKMERRKSINQKMLPMYKKL